MNFIICDHKSGYTVTDSLIRALNFARLNYKYFFLKKKLHKFIYLHNFDYEKFDKKIINSIIFKKIFFSFWHEVKNSRDKNLAIIRNPKDIIISGYLYHLKCNEYWCCNKNISYYHGYKDWHFNKKQKIKNSKLIKFAENFSKNIPYQKKLRKLSYDRGVKYEMDNVSKLTLDGMKKILKQKKIKIIKFEDIVYNSDSVIKEICKFFKYNKIQTKLTILYYKKFKSLNNKKYLKLQKNKKLINNLKNDKNLYKKNYWNKKLTTFFLNKFKDLNHITNNIYKEN